MDLDLRAIKEDERAVIELLAQHYLAELGTLFPADPLFKPNLLRGYWKEQNKYPLFIYHQDKLAGFALVKIKAIAHLISNYGASIIEQFFITKEYRMKGIGTIAAHLLFRQFPGKWEIYVHEKNIPAIRFWRNTITSFSTEGYSEQYEQRLHGYVYSFHS